MTSVIFALLKKDQEMLAHLAPGATPPEPQLYDSACIESIAWVNINHRTSGEKPRKEIQLTSD
ncbi:hypothetical protein KDW_49440 [Dictyobacter vulcani]|uniref:Uncharacterized protein n=2 Tax=Dictyobacter vulcani TaxID=2607529 RepID=A0A5J4KUB3_9CHLR|nr:hypothetical protein KDW_49440 [Dictyobacter vulcani]